MLPFEKVRMYISIKSCLIVSLEGTSEDVIKLFNIFNKLWRRGVPITTNNQLSFEDMIRLETVTNN